MKKIIAFIIITLCLTLQAYSQQIRIGQDSASIRDVVHKNNSHIEEQPDFEIRDISKDRRFVFNGYEIGNYRGELIVLFDSTWHVKSAMWSIHKKMVRSLPSAFDNIIRDIGRTYGEYRGNAAPVHDPTIQRSELYGSGNDVVTCMLEETSIQLTWISVSEYEKFYKDRRKYEDELAKSKSKLPVYKPEPKHKPGIFGDTVVTKSGLMYIDLVKGEGASPKKGKEIVANYTGMFPGGKLFDSNIDSSFHHVFPFTVQIGKRFVIDGWEEGLLSMKVGGKRRLIVPPDLGYGKEGNSAVPPNATLIYDVELLDVK